MEQKQKNQSKNANSGVTASHKTNLRIIRPVKNSTKMKIPGLGNTFKADYLASTDIYSLNVAMGHNMST
ncbi:hypothetical protein [Serratia sp. 2723]|uniref:hypothetical protein n=1 Tax=unclassified Serratia (in: enterobacteria) TaxID=2647522 RepID=UPI003D1ECA76